MKVGTPVWHGEMGRSWARLHDATDRQLAEAGAAVLRLLDPKPGERILDLGCGGGTTSLEIARRVGPGGRVTGVDISPDLVALARRRAEDAPNVTIVEADAAHHPFQPASHDALFSRHGCMFFDDPPAAFANIRRALVPGARVAMSAFTGLAENPWAAVPLRAAERALGPAPAMERGSPGPFAWAEPEVFETALKGAGFRSIAWEAQTVGFTLGAGDHPDPFERACDIVLSIGMVARRVMTEGGDASERVRPLLREELSPHVRDGWVRLGAKIWLVTATA